MANQPRFEVVVSSAVRRKDFPRLGHAVTKSVLKQIHNKLTVDPEGYGEPLHSGLAGYWKLSVGQARVVYKIIDERVLVLVLAVGKRAEGDFENIWDWLSSDRVETRLTQLLTELDIDEDEARPAH